MILPIQSLFNRPGLPGTGVPPMSVDPRDGSVTGDIWPNGAVGVDPVTGNIVTKQQTEAASTVSGPGGVVDSSDQDTAAAVDLSEWDAAEPAPEPPPPIIDVAAIRKSHGSQWNYQGSYLTESAFDKWRRAGRPTACRVSSACGMGAYTFPDGTPCDPGMSDPRFCLDTTERVLQAVTAGAAAANQQLQYGQYGGYYPPPGSAAVTVSGQASPAAWIFGGIIAATLLYAVVNRR